MFRGCFPLLQTRFSTLSKQDPFVEAHMRGLERHYTRNTYFWMGEFSLMRFRLVSTSVHQRHSTAILTQSINTQGWKSVTGNAQSAVCHRTIHKLLSLKLYLSFSKHHLTHLDILLLLSPRNKYRLLQPRYRPIFQCSLISSIAYIRVVPKAAAAMDQHISYKTLIFRAQDKTDRHAVV